MLDQGRTAHQDQKSELAGRTIALLMMAVYAQENAVAASNRAFHSVAIQTALPWAEEVAELIDDLAGRVGISRVIGLRRGGRESGAGRGFEFRARGGGAPTACVVVTRETIELAYIALI